ncbi:hypothetical protein DF3PB_220018 [uncultured Defluviicoccus sp.]|uniref:Uncharacterized protein n=1 Tax=metagenome TaxID=256318 RepID=A0A380TCZ3_9ZZZZ|nr:hypothetical protein DF3PB_220018 [uncultured Defluviicoccus sp.]
MIPGTGFSPEKVFIGFAREFFEHLASEKPASALSGLDMTGHRWTKARLESEIRTVLGDDKVCSPKMLTRSACPELTEVSTGVYQLNHRVPGSKRWSQRSVAFRLTQKPGTGCFRVEFLGAVT